MNTDKKSKISEIREIRVQFQAWFKTEEIILTLVSAKYIDISKSLDNLALSNVRLSKPEP